MTHKANHSDGKGEKIYTVQNVFFFKVSENPPTLLIVQKRGGTLQKCFLSHIYLNTSQTIITHFQGKDKVVSPRHPLYLTNLLSDSSNSDQNHVCGPVPNGLGPHLRSPDIHLLFPQTVTQQIFTECPVRAKQHFRFCGLARNSNSNNNIPAFMELVVQLRRWTINKYIYNR